jgi:hypothetical protein
MVKSPLNVRVLEGAWKRALLSTKFTALMALLQVKRGFEPPWDSSMVKVPTPVMERRVELSEALIVRSKPPLLFGIRCSW